MARIVADCNPGEDIVVAALAAQGCHGVQRKRLPVGDYQVSHGDSVVLFERKTLDDWRSSIIDGRLASQRARADALFKEAGVKLVYLLEGTMPTWTSEYIYGVQNQALASSIPLTSLRDDYHVVHAPHARLDGGGHRARGGPARKRRTDTQACFRRGGGSWQTAS